MKQFFAILGGMGTLATTNFLVEMNKRYRPYCDQEYLDYVLFNHASIPDRTAYILDHSQVSPLEALIESLKQIDCLKPDFIVIPCNTAHYFYQELAEVTEIPILNMLNLTQTALADLPGKKVGVCATEGTVQSGLYQDIIKEAGKDLLLPTKEIQKKVTDLIYQSVKTQGEADITLLKKILRIYQDLGADIILLGCTEVSYVYSQFEHPIPYVIDAEKVLVEATITRGKATQGKNL